MKKALLIIDYQKDFIHGALGFEGAARLDLAGQIRAGYFQKYLAEAGGLAGGGAGGGANAARVAGVTVAADKEAANDPAAGGIGVREAGGGAEAAGAEGGSAGDWLGGADLLLTMDTHGEDYLSTAEGQLIPIPHCLKNTPGWELGLAALAGQAKKIFEKSSFGSLDLANFLREQGYEELHVSGLVSHICVLANAILAQAALPNARIFIHTQLIASPDPRLHEAALDLLAAQGFALV